MYSFVLRASKPNSVDVPDIVEELLGEEYKFEEYRYRRLFQSEEDST